MRRITLLFLLLVFIISSSVQALSWSYPFVVWKENVYEAKQEEFIADSKIGKIIGKVKTKPNDMTGSYYGDASNYYPRGTKYYEIKGISTSTEIAVKEDGKWIKAVYVHKAPFHLMNIFSDISLILAIVITTLIVIGVIFRIKRSKNQ